MSEVCNVTGNRWVWNIAKSVAPGQDWTGEAGSWMGSLEVYSIANADKNLFGNNVTHLMRMKVNNQVPMPMSYCYAHPINSRQ